MTADRPSRLRGVWRLGLFVAWTLVLAVLFKVVTLFDFAAGRPLQRLWARSCCALCGLRVRVEGAPAAGGPTLYAVNHVSYLDIPVLSAVLRAVFVAKDDVDSWPLFGTIARLTRTVMIKRSAREALAQTAELAARLDSGDDLILFPEGTSSDGQCVLPFKSTLFGVVDRRVADGPLTVQPVTIAYVRDAAGRSLDGARAALYAWYDDMTLLPHLLCVLGLLGAEVELRFHEPIRVAEGLSRKDVAALCEARVRDGLTTAWVQAGASISDTTRADASK